MLLDVSHLSLHSIWECKGNAGAERAHARILGGGVRFQPSLSDTAKRTLLLLPIEPAKSNQISQAGKFRIIEAPRHGGCFWCWCWAQKQYIQTEPLIKVRPKSVSKGRTMQRDLTKSPYVPTTWSFSSVQHAQCSDAGAWRCCLRLRLLLVVDIIASMCLSIHGQQVLACSSGWVCNWPVFTHTAGQALHPGVEVWLEKEST
jgi:hypothetical protein